MKTPQISRRRRLHRPRRSEWRDAAPNGDGQSGTGRRHQRERRTARAGRRSGRTRGPGGPGGSGKVAAVAGSTAQVQGQGGQVAVTWTSKTTFTQQVSATAEEP